MRRDNALLPMRELKCAQACFDFRHVEISSLLASSL